MARLGATPQEIELLRRSDSADAAAARRVVAARGGDAAAVGDEAARDVDVESRRPSGHDIDDSARDVDVESRRPSARDDFDDDDADAEAPPRPSARDGDGASRRPSEQEVEFVRGDEPRSLSGIFDNILGCAEGAEGVVLPTEEETF